MTISASSVSKHIPKGPNRGQIVEESAAFRAALLIAGSPVSPSGLQEVDAFRIQPSQTRLTPRTARTRTFSSPSLIATCHTDASAKNVFEYRPVAIIWKSRGTVGPGSLDAGICVPLPAIDTCLRNYRVFWHGERPKTMLPQSREHYIHVMVEVTEEDVQPHLDRFLRPGFYQVVGLRVREADFLFNLKPCAPAVA